MQERAVAVARWRSFQREPVAAGVGTAHAAPSFLLWWRESQLLIQVGERESLLHEQRSLVLASVDSFGTLIYMLASLRWREREREGVAARIVRLKKESSAGVASRAFPSRSARFSQSINQTATTAAAACLQHVCMSASGKRGKRVRGKRRRGISEIRDVYAAKQKIHSAPNMRHSADDEREREREREKSPKYTPANSSDKRREGEGERARETSCV